MFKSDTNVSAFCVFFTQNVKPQPDATACPRHDQSLSLLRKLQSRGVSSYEYQIFLRITKQGCKGKATHIRASHPEESLQNEKLYFSPTKATTLLQSHMYSEPDRSWKGEGLSWLQSGSGSHRAQQIQRPEILECEALRDFPPQQQKLACVSPSMDADHQPAHTSFEPL